MLAADIIVFVEGACQSVNDGDHSDEPSGKCAKIEAALVPVWTA